MSFFLATFKVRSIPPRLLWILLLLTTLSPSSFANFNNAKFESDGNEAISRAGIEIATSHAGQHMITHDLRFSDDKQLIRRLNSEKQFTSQCVSSLLEDPDGDGTVSQVEYATYINSLLCSACSLLCSACTKAPVFEALVVKYQLYFVHSICASSHKQTCVKKLEMHGSRVLFGFDLRKKDVKKDIKILCNSVYLDLKGSSSSQAPLVAPSIPITSSPSYSPTSPVINEKPSLAPTPGTSLFPTTSSSEKPSVIPSANPTQAYTLTPAPSEFPTSVPSSVPSLVISITPDPSPYVSFMPTIQSSSEPASNPSRDFKSNPTSEILWLTTNITFAYRLHLVRYIAAADILYEEENTIALDLTRSIFDMLLPKNLQNRKTMQTLNKYIFKPEDAIEHIDFLDIACPEQLGGTRRMVSHENHRRFQSTSCVRVSSRVQVLHRDDADPKVIADTIRDTMEASMAPLGSSFLTAVSNEVIEQIYFIEEGNRGKSTVVDPSGTFSQVGEKDLSNSGIIITSLVLVLGLSASLFVYNRARKRTRSLNGQHKIKKEISLKPVEISDGKQLQVQPNPTASPSESTITAASTPYGFRNAFCGSDDVTVRCDNRFTYECDDITVKCDNRFSSTFGSNSTPIPQFSPIHIQDCCSTSSASCSSISESTAGSHPATVPALAPQGNLIGVPDTGDGRSPTEIVGYISTCKEEKDVADCTIISTISRTDQCSTRQQSNLTQNDSVHSDIIEDFAKIVDCDAVASTAAKFDSESILIKRSPHENVDQPEKKSFLTFLAGMNAAFPSLHAATSTQSFALNDSREKETGVHVDNDSSKWVESCITGTHGDNSVSVSILGNEPAFSSPLAAGTFASALRPPTLIFAEELDQETDQENGDNRKKPSDSLSTGESSEESSHILLGASPRGFQIKRNLFFGRHDRENGDERSVEERSRWRKRWRLLRGKTVSEVNDVPFSISSQQDGYSISSCSHQSKSGIPSVQTGTNDDAGLDMRPIIGTFAAATLPLHEDFPHSHEELERKNEISCNGGLDQAIKSGTIPSTGEQTESVDGTSAKCGSNNCARDNGLINRVCVSLNDSSTIGTPNSLAASLTDQIAHLDGLISNEDWDGLMDTPSQYNQEKACLANQSYSSMSESYISITSRELTRASSVNEDQIAVLERLIESDDWEGLIDTASQYREQYSCGGSHSDSDTSLSDSRSSQFSKSLNTPSGSASDERIATLEGLIEADDWQGIMNAASQYKKEDSERSSSYTSQDDSMFHGTRNLTYGSRARNSIRYDEELDSHSSISKTEVSSVMCQGNASGVECAEPLSHFNNIGADIAAEWAISRSYTYLLEGNDANAENLITDKEVAPADSEV